MSSSSEISDEHFESADEHFESDHVAAGLNMRGSTGARPAKSADMRHLTPHFLALVEKVRYGHLIDDVERLDAALASTSARNAELEEQLRAQLAKTAGLERELADASIEKTELSDRLEIEVGKTGELEKKLVDASNETEELRSWLEVEEGKTAELGKKLEKFVDASNETEELRARLEVEEGKTAELEKKLEKKFVDASKETEELRTRLDIEQGKTSHLGGKLMAASVEEKAFKELAAELEKMLADASNEAEELRTQLDIEQGKTSELRRELRDASIEENKLGERLKAEVGRTAELERNLARVSSGQSRAGPKSGAEWQFNTGHDDWSGFPADRSEELQARFEEYSKGGAPALVRMKSGVEEYEIDLGKMQQTNVKTRTTRDIRCTINTPAHWTRCCSLAAIYRTQPTESFELSGFSGFEELRLNAVYTKDESVVVNGHPVWWSTAGDLMVYCSPTSQNLNIYIISPSYPEVRSGSADLATAYLPGLDPWSWAGWRHKISGKRCLNAVARPPASSGVASLMSIAIDVSEARMMSKLSWLLSNTVIHQQPHYGGSACNSFKMGVKVIRVVRIENWHLWMKYLSHAEQIKRDLLKYGIQVKAIEPRLPPALETFSTEYGGGVDATLNERLLFHGTSYQTAVQIALEGFDFRLSRPGYYGQGTYFGSQACKCHQYTDQGTVHTMLLSRVAIGDIHYAEKVNKECRRPPVHTGTTRCCDSVVAKPGPMPGHRHGTQTHQEFVIFDKFQAYPELIVQYVVEP